MNIDEIYACFLMLSHLEETVGERWRSLCAAAGAKLDAMLLPDVDTADPRLTLAAAGDAFLQYSLAQQGSGGNTQSLKIGDISISEGSGGGGSASGARALRDELLAAAAPLLDCSCDCLRQIPTEPPVTPEIPDEPEPPPEEPGEPEPPPDTETPPDQAENTGEPETREFAQHSGMAGTPLEAGVQSADGGTAATADQSAAQPEGGGTSATAARMEALI